MLRCRKLLKLLLLSWCFSTTIFAEEINVTPIENWEFGLAAGIGGITNPLKDADDIFLPVIPQVSYYGDRFFLENTDLGFSLIENEKFNVNLYGRFNEDKRYFPNADTTDIVFTSLGWKLDPTIKVGHTAEIKLKSRHLTYLAGLQFHYHHQNYHGKLSLLTDISNVHHGEEAEFSFGKTWQQDDWLLDLGFGLLWKSQQIVDYYYGLKPVEVSDKRDEYYPDASLTPYLKLVYQYAISEKVKFITSVKIDKMDSERYRSPLVNDRYINSFFMGFAYDF
ncbi:MipA/OmpV family protein [Thalassotalea sp. ND16A]|uniref:MipA/OmpV family protein n=1 Tax=Thalassotalea sp. ND16A TaxID=1535422 RepID=UPI000519ECF5|nr:MipA/OmpV family protein [Thalassotalea sp. ND16A]KGK00395.1 hypothetical protein ND16A_3602 [Thalassotalea sp. ND16A]